MGITRRQFEQTREYHPSLQTVPGWESAARVDAVLVTLEGRRGGQSGWWLWGPNARREYQLLLDLSGIATAIPAAWVVAPADAEIRHLNVFHGGHCPVLRQSLPMVCWGAFAAAWAVAPPEHRTLGAALEYLRQLLNHQNPKSPAR